MQSFVYSTEQIYELFDQAVQQEILWTNHIVGNQILGITESSTEIYTKYLANARLKAIGLDPLYKDEQYKKTPYNHLEKFADTKKDGNTKGNFFESSITSYVMSSGVDGWEEI
jgi:ribonucleoside-diphosphate reductase beta chain